MADGKTFDPQTFDPIWEEKYASGHAQRYPWDSVVSFVLRNAPKRTARGEVRLLEVGCGTASNLWFAAREGFRVWGIDASASAIAAARSRFKSEGVEGTLEVADFTRIPFGDAMFQLAIDRAAISCTGRGAARSCVAELRRVLAPGGRFFFNPYSDRHSSAASGREGPDGVRLEISAGSLTGAGQICFYGRKDVEALLGEGWRILRLQHMEATEHAGGAPTVHAEWRVVAEKVH